MAFWEPEDLQGALSGTSHSSHGRPRKTVQARHRHAWAVRMPHAGTTGPEGTALSSSPRGPTGERQPLPVRCSASNLRGSWAGSSLGSRNLRGQLGSWTGSAGCLPAPRSTGLSPQPGGTTWASTARSRSSEHPLRECRGLPALFVGRGNDGQA